MASGEALVLFPSADAEPLRDVVAARQVGGGVEAGFGADAGGTAEVEGVAEAEGAVGGRPVDLIVPDGSWLEATRINLQLPAAPRVRLAEAAEVEAAEATAETTTAAAAAEAPELEPSAAEGDPLSTRATGTRQLSGESSRVRTTSVDAAEANGLGAEQQQSLSSYAADALSLRGESSLGAVARALGALREAVTM